MAKKCDYLSFVVHRGGIPWPAQKYRPKLLFNPDAALDLLA